MPRGTPDTVKVDTSFMAVFWEDLPFPDHLETLTAKILKCHLTKIIKIKEILDTVNPAPKCLVR